MQRLNDKKGKASVKMKIVAGVCATVLCAVFAASAETAVYEQLVNDGYSVTATPNWGGGRKLAFTFGGRAASIVEPTSPRAEKPWVWSLYSFDAATTRRTGADYLVRDGFYNAYLNIDDTCGDDTGIAALDAFYTYLTGTLGLAGKPGMVGCGRGAFYAVRYAAAHTANVSKLLLFSPVLSFRNFQGEIGSYWTSTAPDDWGADSRMPVRLAGVLRDASVPVTMYVGGEDKIAPDADNGCLFDARYADGTLCKKNVRANYAHEPFGLEVDEVSAAVEFFGSTIRQRLYVNKNATGTGDGSSWTDAAKTLADAVSLMMPGAEVEIWIAGDLKRIDFDLAVELTKGISIRGGFAGTETTLAQRASNGISNWDGENLVDFIKFTSVYDPALWQRRLGVDILIDRIVFRRAHARAITRHDCAGALTLQDCVFEDNGGTVTCTSGHALQITGQSDNPNKSYLTISNCVFRGNVGRTAGNTPEGLGGAIRARCLERFTLDDSTFVSNGVPYSIASKGHGTGDYYNGGLSGAAIGATAAPLVARNCTFIGNTARVTGSAGKGGTVNLDGACGGSAFTNCLFLANQDGYLAWNGFNGGALVVNAATADAKVTVSGSTIAYNLNNSPMAGAGITVVKGAVEVVDSVVAGNVRRPDSTGGADISTGDDGSVAVCFSRLSGRSAAYASGNVTFGEGVLFGDPAFVTTPSTIATRCTKTTNRVYWNVDDDANFAAVCASDVHLSSGATPSGPAVSPSSSANRQQEGITR